MAVDLLWIPSGLQLCMYSFLDMTFLMRRNLFCICCQLYVHFVFIQSVWDLNFRDIKIFKTMFVICNVDSWRILIPPFFFSSPQEPTLDLLALMEILPCHKTNIYIDEVAGRDVLIIEYRSGEKFRAPSERLRSHRISGSHTTRAIIKSGSKFQRLRVWHHVMGLNVPLSLVGWTRPNTCVSISRGNDWYNMNAKNKYNSR